MPLLVLTKRSMVKVSQFSVNEDNVINKAAAALLSRTATARSTVIGLEDIVVVDTPDALLVAPRERAQAVKDTVAELKIEGLADLL